MLTRFVANKTEIWINAGQVRYVRAVDGQTTIYFSSGSGQMTSQGVDGTPTEVSAALNHSLVFMHTGKVPA